jgi:hypothetical protein
MSFEQPPSHDHPESVADALASRVQAIVQAAEREATAVHADLETRRREAEAERRGYLEAARAQADAVGRQRLERLQELTTALTERAQECARQLDDLLSLMGEASSELARDHTLTEELLSSEPVLPSRGPGQESVADSTGLDDPEGVGTEAVSEGGGGTESDHDAARLAAVQMAVAGSTREEVERFLRDRFGLLEVDVILDDVFGTGSQGTSRISWGPA